MSHSAFTRFAWFNVVYNLAVVLWGAFVRVTGSGAGCGSHWPLCNGEVIPRAAQLETLIEYSHRLTSGLALVFVAVLFVQARKLFAPGQRVRRAALAALLLMGVEALVGAGLVLGDLVVDDTSTLRIVVMGVHLATTFLLLAALALTATWSRTPAGSTWRPLQRADLRLGGALLLLVVTGISGAVSALGVTLYPADSHGQALAQEISAESPLVLRLQVAHPMFAVAAALVALAVARRQLRRPISPAATSHARLVTLLVFVQMAGGVLNIALMAPAWMQLVHLLLADLLWLAFVLLADAMLTAPDPS